MKNFYEILNVSPDADFDAIRMAYRKLASAYHPDKYPENTKFAEDMMKQINSAYNVLSDQSKREQYDAWLAMQEPSSASTETRREEPSRQQNTSASEASRSHKAKSSKFHADDNGRNEYSPRKLNFAFFKKHWFLVLAFTWMVLLGLSELSERAEKYPNWTAKDSTSYQLKMLQEPLSGYRISSNQPGFSLDLHKSNGYDQLYLNGNKYPGASFAYVSSIYEISKDDRPTGYVLVTACGGNGCGPAYMFIDLEHKIITDIPIQKATFSTLGQTLNADGFEGVNKLGDAIPTKLTYIVSDLKGGTKMGSWIDPSMNDKYRKMIGGHPDDFFRIKHYENRWSHF